MRNRISNNYGLFEFSKSQIIDLEQVLKYLVYSDIQLSPFLYNYGIKRIKP